MTDQSASSVNRRRAALVVRISVSVALVALLAVRMDWSQIGVALWGLRWELCAAAWMLYLVSQVTSAVRWAGLARPLGFELPIKRYLQLYFEGSFFGLCLPGSIGGDVVKAYRLAHDTSGRMLAGCSVLADRLSGLAALLVLAGTGLIVRSQAFDWPAAIGVGLLLSAAAIGAISGMTYLAGRRQRIGAGAVQAVRSRWSKLAVYARRQELLPRAFGWSLVVQSLNVATVLVLARGLVLDAPAVAFFIAVPLVALAATVPISLQGVGIREGGLALLLSQYGVPPEQGAALGFLWFLVAGASGLLGGVIYLAHRGGTATPTDLPSVLQSTERLPGASTVTTETPRSALPETFEQLQSAREFKTESCDAFDSQKTRTTSMSLSIVVPIYNEDENIHRLYEALDPVMRGLDQPYEILLVDDGSTDGSPQKLRALARKDGRVRVIEFRRNYGQTAAMDAGIRFATGDVIVMLDADLQNDPTDIPMMLAKLDEGYDLVHGWRRDRQDAFVNRKLPSKIANWIIARVTGFPVHDLGCTLKVVRREIAQELHLYGEMHRFIPVLAHWQGARCVEVVTKHHPRRFGTSKYGISRTLRVILDLITVKYMVQYLTSPMKLFGTIGLSCLALSGLSGFSAMVMKLLQQVDMTGNPLLLLSASAGLGGMQFFILGMLGELGARTYYESQHKQPYAIRELVNFDLESGRLRARGEQTTVRAA
jgi:glycosyltransferase involved in cell wall biosynthesis/uncharacterized membrane protein YbhN (UPF0104 family)